MKNKGNIFISYRRSVSCYPAGRIYDSLHRKGYDVFMDIESILNGDFKKKILEEIAARSNFIIIFSHGTIDRFSEPRDLLRKEIECALRHKRNIIPVLVGGYSMSELRPRLKGKLKLLSSFQAVTIYDEYFPEGINKICRGLRDFKNKG